MKENRIDKRKIIITIIATLLVLSIIGVVAYAEFTKSSRAKRVVASNNTADALFSSNYMLRHIGLENTVNNRKTFYTTSGSSAAIGRVTICNYAQGNPVKFNSENDIEYVLTAEIVKVSGGVKTVVTDADFLDGRTASISYRHGDTTETVTLPYTQTGTNHYSHSFASQILSHLESDAHSCVVTLSPEFYGGEGKYYLYLSATPIDGNGDPISRSDLYKLDCIFDSDVAVEHTPVTWTGKFNESGAFLDTPSESGLPTAYDGFRYVIEGNGSGTMTIIWNNAKVTPSKIFLMSRIDALGVLLDDIYLTSNENTLEVKDDTTIHADDADNDWKYVRFKVNSDVISHYDLQVYYAKGVYGSEDLDTWGELKNNFRCTYNAD